MNAVFHYIKTLAIVHKSRCYNHLTNMKPKSEHNNVVVDYDNAKKMYGTYKASGQASKQEKLKQ